MELIVDFYFIVITIPTMNDTNSTAIPVTIVTMSNQTTETPGTTAPMSNQTTQPASPSSIGTTVAPSPTPKPKKGGFDGGSFGGGIALGAGIAIILYIAYRIYASRKTSGYSTM